MWRPPEQWAMFCMSCEFLSKMCVRVWGRAGFVHGMPIQVSYPSLTLNERVDRKRRFIRESARTYSCWLNERKSEDSTRLWYSHKSSWWRALVTTSKDKKTKQIVEIFLWGRVVWQLAMVGGNSPLFVQPILLPCQASCAHPPGEKASKKEWDGRRKKRCGEKKGRKIVKYGKEKVTKLTTCSFHILGSVFWLYMIR